ncbi:hypothetical protein Theos_0158 [Thermus oshimai JL-2]|uniref:Lipoprotein n=1 Tax=Thermus oshimai JL-2 TaxID=751945 RepID=K7QTK6_THEOS|nr:hypothetical protein [Thermus oshimai]AFV75241.1 hypothetical protein Theos_0158 [Thermus oshimai JL-2]
MRRWIVLVLLLSGCVPVATLRTPEAARGPSFTVGATLVTNPFANRDQYPVAPLPYLAYAEGDGTLEWNLNLQWGLRGGAKWALAPGAALDFGLTLPPPSPDADWSQGVPVVVDLGLLLGGEGVYLSPRVHWVWVPGGRPGLLLGLSTGVYERAWILELGTLAVGEGFILSLSGAWRFGNAP